MIFCKGCNTNIKYNSFYYHCKKHHSNDPDAENNSKGEGDGANVDDANAADGDANAGPGKRSAKIAKRRQSEPQPICNINVKQVSSKTQKAKSTPVAKKNQSNEM